MTEGFAQQQLVHRLRRVCSLVCDSLCMAHALLPLLPNYSNNTEYSRMSSTRTTLATYSICGQLALPSTPLVEARPILPDCIETNTNGDIMSAGERTLRRIITDTTNNNTTTMNPLRTLLTMPRFRPAFIRPSAELLRPCDDPEVCPSVSCFLYAVVIISCRYVWYINCIHVIYLVCNFTQLLYEDDDLNESTELQNADRCDIANVL